MTTLEEELAALTPEERAQVEADAEAQAAVTKFAKETGLYDERQQGVLLDPRMLGPVGG